MAPKTKEQTPASGKSNEAVFTELLLHAKGNEWEDVRAGLPKVRHLVNLIPKGRTYGLLHQAAYWNNLEAIKQLVVEFHCDLYLETREAEPKCAQEVALQEGSLEAADYLNRVVEAVEAAAASVSPEPSQKLSSKRAKTEHSPGSTAKQGDLEQINGVLYQRSLLELARTALNERSGCRAISKELAEELYRAFRSSGSATEAAWRSLEYIFDGHICEVSPEAKQFLRQELDSKQDLALKDSVQVVDVAATDGAAETGAREIKVKGKVGSKKNRELCVGDDIRIKDLIYQVTKVSDGVVGIAGLHGPLEPDAQISRVDQAPIGWLETMDGMTQAFIDNVEKYDDKEQPSVESLLQEVLGKTKGKLPKDMKARREKLIKSYTQEEPSMHAFVNTALKDNQRDNLRKFAGYIRELRDCFRFGAGDHIVMPFKGKTVWRGDKLDPERLSEYLKRWSISQKVTFPWFVSTSSKKRGILTAGRNVLYRISCFKFGTEGHFFPARIDKFSVFPGEEEVLWPPQCKFRIVNVKHYKHRGGSDVEQDEDVPDMNILVEMETCEWPSVWEIIEQKRWGKLDKYARANPEVMKTGNAKRSVVGKVCKTLAEDPTDAVAEPIEICAAYGADLNEEDPETGESAAVVIAQKVKDLGIEAPAAAPLKKVLTALHDYDVDMSKPSKGKAGGKSVEGILGPDVVESLKSSKSYFKQEHTVKYVRALLEMAARYTSGIYMREAKVLVEHASKCRGITPAKDRTLKRIAEGPNEDSKLPLPRCSPAAKRHLLEGGR